MNNDKTILETVLFASVYHTFDRRFFLIAIKYKSNKTFNIYSSNFKFCFFKVKKSKDQKVLQGN